VIGSSADVRTTVNIEDGLYREAKVRAAREGVTVTSVVEEALRQLLRSRPGSWQRGELPALPQTGGLLPGVDLPHSGPKAADTDESDMVDTSDHGSVL
jgi:hypothetical protein